MKNILFVCEGNIQRSPTAEALYKNSVYEVRSAGIHPKAREPLNHDLLLWADRIFVMEKYMRNRIRKQYPDIYQSKPIICLFIPDNYDYMEPELTGLLQMKLRDYLGPIPHSL